MIAKNYYYVNYVFIKNVNSNPEELLAYRT